MLDEELVYQVLHYIMNSPISGVETVVNVKKEDRSVVTTVTASRRAHDCDEDLQRSVTRQLVPGRRKEFV